MNMGRVMGRNKWFRINSMKNITGNVNCLLYIIHFIGC